MFRGISSNEWSLNGEIKCEINACKHYTYFTLNTIVSRICSMEYLRKIYVTHRVNDVGRISKGSKGIDTSICKNDIVMDIVNDVSRL